MRMEARAGCREGQHEGRQGPPKQHRQQRRQRQQQQAHRRPYWRFRWATTPAMPPAGHSLCGAGGQGQGQGQGGMDAGRHLLEQSNQHALSSCLLVPPAAPAPHVEGAAVGPRGRRAKLGVGCRRRQGGSWQRDGVRRAVLHALSKQAGA